MRMKKVEEDDDQLIDEKTDNYKRTSVFVFVFDHLMTSMMIKLTTTDGHLGYPGSDQEASFQTGS